ncbi:MAG TPA: hypothetical protein VJV79_31190 [Polyangiaceae bacterium]|nr:hypothetical protein [Polyangiaceae bacterium]
MSAANPLPDSALQPAPEASDDASLPTQPWHAPPTSLDSLDELEPEFELDGFDFHDTIPAPPWLDEPADASDLPAFPAR